MYEVRDKPALYEFVASLMPEFESDPLVIHRLPTERIDAKLAELGLVREDFYETFAIYLAREFLSGRMDFDVADRAINDLYLWAEFAWGEGSFALAVYLAFDAGEYRLPRDPVDVEPEVLFTIPMLRTLLARFGVEERAG